MKIFSFILLSIFVIGCSSTTPSLEPTSTKATIIEKKVMVGCRIPDLTCDFQGEGYEPTIKLLECVKLQKEAIKLCNELAEEDNGETEVKK